MDLVPQPLDFMLSILEQTAKEDTGKYFEDPVDASVKGYYEKIKQPMCLSRMREKLRNREYLTWRGFVKDFELICENAKMFNAPTNKIHKLAINLQRVGRKLLQQHELTARRCIHMLHPAGPKVAAAEEESQVLQHLREDAERNSQLLLASMDSGADAAGLAALQHKQHDAATKQPPPAPEDLSITHMLWDAADDPQQQHQHHQQLEHQLGPADWGLLFRELPDTHIDNVTQQLKQPVVYQPYSGSQQLQLRGAPRVSQPQPQHEVQTSQQQQQQQAVQQLQQERQEKQHDQQLKQLMQQEQQQQQEVQEQKHQEPQQQPATELQELEQHAVQLAVRKQQQPTLQQQEQQQQKPVQPPEQQHVSPQHQQQQQVQPRYQPQQQQAAAQWQLKQPVGWRCNWLRTRIQELSSLIHLLQSEGAALPTAVNMRSAAAHAVDGSGDGQQGSSGASLEQADPAWVLQVQPNGVLLQQHIAAFGPVAILQSPFFVAHLAACKAASLRQVGVAGTKQAAAVATAGDGQAKLWQQGQEQQVQDMQPRPLASADGTPEQLQQQQQAREQQQQDPQQQQQGPNAAAAQAPANMDIDTLVAASAASQDVNTDAGSEAGAGASRSDAAVTAAGAQQAQQQPQQQQDTNTAAVAPSVQPWQDAAVGAELPIAVVAAPEQQAAAVTGSAAATAQASIGDASDTALLFSSLDLVEHQLVAARLMISRAFGIEVSLAPAGVRLGQYTAARVLGDGPCALGSTAGTNVQKRGTAAAGIGLTRGLSGALGSNGGAKRSLQREGSMAGSLKRRRLAQGSGIAAIGTLEDDGLLSPGGSLPSRLVERTVTSIHIPSVRELPKDEWEARKAAATHWRDAVTQHGQRSALARPPPEVRRVLDPAAFDEGSSSEDTSDEAYRILHKPMEEDEHIRLCGLPGGARKRNKNKTKQANALKQDRSGQLDAVPSKQDRQQQQQQPTTANRQLYAGAAAGRELSGNSEPAAAPGPSHGAQQAPTGQVQPNVSAARPSAGGAAAVAAVVAGGVSAVEAGRPAAAAPGSRQQNPAVAAKALQQGQPAAPLAGAAATAAPTVAAVVASNPPTSAVQAMSISGTAAAAVAAVTRAFSLPLAGTANPAVLQIPLASLPGQQQQHQHQQQQLVWVQQSPSGQPLLMAVAASPNSRPHNGSSSTGKAGRASPGALTAAAAATAARLKQAQQRRSSQSPGAVSHGSNGPVVAAAATAGSNNKQSHPAELAGSIRTGKAAVVPPTQRSALAQRMATHQLASTRTNGTAAGATGQSKAQASLKGAGAAATAAPKKTPIAATRDDTPSRDAAATASKRDTGNGKQEPAKGVQGNKTAGKSSTPAAATAPAGCNSETCKDAAGGGTGNAARDGSRSPATTASATAGSKSPASVSLPVAGGSGGSGSGMAAGTRRATAAAAAAAAANKSRSSSRIRAAAATKNKARFSK